MPVEKNTIIAGTLQTDPRSGGLKRSSGVNVLPIVSEGEKKCVIYFALRNEKLISRNS